MKSQPSSPPLPNVLNCVELPFYEKIQLWLLFAGFCHRRVTYPDTVTNTSGNGYHTLTTQTDFRAPNGPYTKNFHTSDYGQSHNRVYYTLELFE